MTQWIRQTTRERIYLRDGHTCMWCEDSVYNTPGIELTLDHVVPQAIGGDNKVTNLVTACRTCKCSRQDTPVKAFAQSLADRGKNPKRVANRVRNAQRRVLPKLAR